MHNASLRNQHSRLRICLPAIASVALTRQQQSEGSNTHPYTQQPSPNQLDTTMLIYPEVGLSWAEVPEAERQRYESRAAAYWDSFYKKNENKFYKDRHYFDREFPELLHGPLRVMEVRGSSCMHQNSGRVSGAV